MTQLGSARLALRRFMPEDAEALYRYLSRPEAVAFEPYGPMDLAACRAEAARRAQDNAFWAVVLRDGRQLIGNVYLGALTPPALRTYELGYVFHPDYWHQGYATEACHVVMEYAFTMMGAHRITAQVNPENTASWRLLERLGLAREGLLRKNVFFRTDEAGFPVWQDTYLYAKLAED